MPEAEAESGDSQTWDASTWERRLWVQTLPVHRLCSEIQIYHPLVGGK